MNYLDELRRTPWLYSEPVSRHAEVKEVEEPSYPPWKTAAVWGKFPRERQFLIIKMEKKFLEKAADFLEKHFFKNDILCKGVSLKWDQEAVQYYKDLMKYWLRDRTSVLAIEEGNERIVGVLVARIIYLTKKQNLDIDYSRIGICNQRVQEIQDLRVNMRRQILKVVALERAESQCFEIKLFCVDRVETIADDIERRMVKCLYVLASEANVPLLIGVMTSPHDQKIMRSEGFKVAFSAKYEDLKKREYVLFPSNEPEASVVGFYKYMEEGLYRTPYMEKMAAPRRIPSDELPAYSTDDSLSDPDTEPYTLIDVYPFDSDSDDDSIWSETESHNDIRKFIADNPYDEEEEEEEEEDYEEEDFSEYSGLIENSDPFFFNE
ncbi:uncharacterized protein [Halyomorpha halys]|uniref:uncharacterized protein n=1 Tax=Halyomorpha halys TaxID=286706 RepID=UPI0006D525A5|nr:uncharacterized protein LOC106681171 [Halyomorpha halys]